MNTIQKDCFFYIESGVKYEDSRIRAACIECKNKLPSDPMFWSGSLNGYGDYDLYCSICNKPIYVRDENDDTTSV